MEARWLSNQYGGDIGNKSCGTRGRGVSSTRPTPNRGSSTSSNSPFRQLGRYGGRDNDPVEHHCTSDPILHTVLRNGFLAGERLRGDGDTQK